MLALERGDGYRVYGVLDPILQKLGACEFGRICQVLLGYAFLEAGYQVPILQLSGRPDMVAHKGNVSYALEVKAQTDSKVSLKTNDILGVTGAGPKPVIAVLTYPDPNTRWIFVDAKRLERGTYNKIFIAHYSIPELEQEINGTFPTVATRMRKLAMTGSGALERAFKDAEIVQRGSRREAYSQ